MADVLNIANAVAAELSSYGAEVLFCPEFELRELETMKVCVVPLSIQYKRIARDSHEEVLKVQIGFLKRADEDDLETLLPAVESLGFGFLGRKIAGATCIGVAYDPIYSPEHLRERRQFTSVIELAFKKAS